MVTAAVDDIAYCAAAVMKDRALATQAADAVAAMQRWSDQHWRRWPCFTCRATGHAHDRRDDGSLVWERCAPCEGQGWYWRKRPGGAECTDREILALFESERRRRS